MSILALSPNNKNQYRKYPLKQSANFCSDDGYTVPDDLLVNCSITSTYGKHRIYIRQIFYKDGVLRITIASVIDNIALGVFSGTVTTNFTALTLTPFIPYVSGSIAVGNVLSLQDISRVLNFTQEQAELEESTIFCYVHPRVTSIADKNDNKLRGRVAFGTLTNTSRTLDSKDVLLEATNPENIKNAADKSSLLGNCPTPVIKTINGIAPYPAPQGNLTTSENDGNVYIVGIEPVMFYGSQDQPGVVKVSTEGITLDSLCTEKHKLLPPVDISGFTLDQSPYKDLYYSKPGFISDSTSPNYPYTIPRRLASNFNNTTKPEFYFWPQFVKAEYYSYWNLPPE